MTIQSTTPELDRWLGPRRQQAADAISRLTADDMTGPGGLFTENDLAVQRGEVQEAARKLARLGGWLEYDELPKALRGMCEGAVRQVLIALNGDLAEFDEAYKALDKRKGNEAFTRTAFENCQSPYSVAKKIIAMWPKMRTKAAPDYLAGMTVDQWQAQAAENARIKAESMAQRKAAKEEWAEEEKARQAALLEMRKAMR